MNAFESGKYRNVFKEIGKSDEEINAKINDCINTFL